jgi:tetratricopeptide (TPR) repeat protein
MAKIYLLLLVIISTNVFAQKIEQKGWITEINSGKKSLAGTQIDFIGAVTTTSDDDGNFVLNFSEKEFGQSIYMKAIYKKGFEVVNTEELRPSILNKESKLKIVLCPEGYINQKKAEYYKVSVEALTSEYKKKSSELEQKLEETNTNEKQLYSQLEKLRSDFNIAHENADELAEKFARTNFDDVSEIYKEAFKEYRTGNVENAINVLNKTDYNSEFKKIGNELERINNLDSELHERENNYKEQRKELTQNLKLKAELHLLNLEPNVSDSLYYLICRLDTTNYDNHFEYALFLQKYKNFDKAVLLWEKTHELTAFENQKANCFRNIGSLYREMERFDPAENNFKKSIEIRQRFAAEYPESYLPKLASTYSGLASLYAQKGDVTMAIHAFEEAIEIESRVYKEKKSEESAEQFATTLLNLGNFLTEIKEFERAEVALLNSYNLTKVLFEKDKEKYKPILSNTLNILGNHTLQTDESKAEAFYVQAHSYYKELAAKYPAIYQSDVAITSSNIGSFYLARMEFDKAQIYFKQAQNIFIELSGYYPSVYLLKLANVQNNIGNLNTRWKRYGLAKDSYDKSIATYRSISKRFSIEVSNEIAKTLSNKAVSFIEQDLYKDAILSLKESVEIYQSILPENLTGPSTKNLNLETLNNFGIASNNLAISYKNTKDYQNATEAYTQSIEVKGILAKKDPENFTIDLAITEGNLANLYLEQDKYSKGEKLYKSAVSTFKKNCCTSFQDNIAYSTVLNNFGRLKYKTKEYTSSIMLYETSKEILQELPSKYENLLSLNKAIIENNLGDSYFANNNINDARSSYTNALTLSGEYIQKIETSNRALSCFAKAVSCCGDCFYGTNKRFAKKCYKEAIPIWEELFRRTDDQEYLERIEEYRKKI